VEADSELTLKRFRDTRGHWFLVSENRTAGYAPIEIKKTTNEFDPDKLQIVGIYCGHIHTGQSGGV
jgi:SOS-response transcriptional repressor LexA